jgi:prepilin-type N-terminal cleavage/methylation domain-containing protein
MQRHPLHTQHGFSLIEMLIALVVLSIALLGMSRASVSMITVHTENERLARASALLQDRMETLKHSGYSGVATVSSTEAYGTISQYSTYKRVTSVAVDTPAANMKTVTVTIYWQNDRHTLSASTILAE